METLKRGKYKFVIENQEVDESDLISMSSILRDWPDEERGTIDLKRFYKVMPKEETSSKESKS